MDISLLFRFPGILILIGVILLILAIIIGIIAYKTPVETEFDDIEEEDKIEENIVNESVNTKEEISAIKEQPTTEKENEDEEIKKEPTLIDITPVTVNKPASEEKKEDNTLAPEEKSTKNETIKSESIPEKEEETIDKASIEEFKFSNPENTRDNFESIVAEKSIDSDLEDRKKEVTSILEDKEEPEMFNSEFDEESTSIEPEKFEPTFSFEKEENRKPTPFDKLREEDSKRVIYGGQKPLDHVDLSFDDDTEKEPYSEKINQEEVVPRLIIEDEPKKKNEDVELL